ncbi:MAG: hypothetical protein LKJ69_07685 [Lactobacillus sp.]|nr:hypothetical protein [Lactobacillus sp.]MCI2033273.1 hypothetical protein [Lactobacillus sp.]
MKITDFEFVVRLKTLISDPETPTDVRKKLAYARTELNRGLKVGIVAANVGSILLFEAVNLKLNAPLFALFRDLQDSGYTSLKLDVVKHTGGFVDGD